jgi:exosortase A-associated hydrolase 2
LIAGHYIQGSRGPLFVLHSGQLDSARRRVLVVPPFAEEMNKSRRMVACVADGLSRAGIATVIPDLYGTGDSAGDFEEADWEGWMDDLGSVIEWIGGPAGGTDVLAIRLGAALADSAVRRGLLQGVRTSVFWQPTFDGTATLRQFLRLRLAAAMMGDGPRETLKDLLARIAAGESISVAGYRLSARLAGQLQKVDPPDAPAKELGEIHWMEVVRGNDADLSASSDGLIQNAQRQGAVLHASATVGEPFWAATEIVTIDNMVEATIRAFNGSVTATAVS